MTIKEIYKLRLPRPLRMDAKEADDSHRYWDDRRYHAIVSRDPTRENRKSLFPGRIKIMVSTLHRLKLDERRVRERHPLPMPSLSLTRGKHMSFLTNIAKNTTIPGVQDFTLENEEFNKGFLESWNSGAESRDHETFSRHVRQSLGINNFFKKRRYIIEDREEAYDRMVKIAKKLGLKILFGSNEVIWFIRVVNNVPVVYSECRISDSVLDIAAEGMMEYIDMVINEVEANFSDRGIELCTLTGFAPDGSAMTRTDFLYPGRDEIAKDHFYPWLKEKYKCTITELFDEYLASNRSILFQIGSPGTGKSTMIRTLMLYAKRKQNYLADNQHVLESQAFGGWLCSAERGSIVAAEDADALTRSREKEGNATMSALLAAAQGVVHRNVKFVISTNLSSLNRVDEALVRKGRCFEIMQYELLSARQAAEIREIELLPAFDFDKGKKFTLAEAFYPDDHGGDRPDRHVSGIGFQS